MDYEIKDTYEVDRVGDDWRGPLHQWERENSGELHVVNHTMPNKLKIACDFLLDELKKEKGTVLDVGCYAGYLYEWLLREEYGDCYTGIDFDVSEAKRLHDVPVFIETDLMDYVQRFDYVFCSRVLLHQPDFYKTLDHLLTLTKRAAIFVTLVSEEKKIVKQELESGESIYRYTDKKKEIDKCYTIEWLNYVDKKDCYSTFVIRGQCDVTQ